MNPTAQDGQTLAREIQYVILDQRKPLSAEQKKFQQKLFLYWSSYWNGVLDSVGVAERMDPSEFFNQHKVTALIHGDEVVAMHVMCCFDREEFETSTYFRHFDRDFLAAMKAANVRRLLTLQYLTFNPEWKRKKMKPIVVLPMTIVSLSMRQQAVENADAVVSVARRDNGASNCLVKMNFQEVLESGVYNNTPVSYQLSAAPAPYPHPDVQELTNYYWDSRIEVTDNINTSHKDVA